MHVQISNRITDNKLWKLNKALCKINVHKSIWINTEINFNQNYHFILLNCVRQSKMKHTKLRMTCKQSSDGWFDSLTITQREIFAKYQIRVAIQIQTMASVELDVEKISNTFRLLLRLLDFEQKWLPTIHTKSPIIIWQSLKWLNCQTMTFQIHWYWWELTKIET